MSEGRKGTRALVADFEFECPGCKADDPMARTVLSTSTASLRDVTLEVCTYQGVGCPACRRSYTIEVTEAK